MAVILITGCSSGIGRALARQFKARGHAVWATARQPADVEALNAEGFVGIELDVNDSTAVGALVERLGREVGGLDMLINNAGYGAMGPLLDGDLRRQFETNVFALVDVTRACFALLRARRGRVVNIGSVSGLLVTPFAGAYCASKAAVHALSQALRMELAPFGIGVTEVQPGAIASRFADNASQTAEPLIAETSAWWPMREGIRARARASQDKPTSADEFAKAVVEKLDCPRPPRLIRAGNGSRALPLLSRWVPAGLLEWILRRRFGL